MDIGDAIEHFQRGMELYREGILDQAFEEVLSAIKFDPNVADYYYWAGVILISLRRFDESLNYFRKAVEINPKNAEYHFGLASSLFENDKFDESILEFKKAISLNPNEGKYHWALSLAYFQLKNNEEGLKELNKALELDPNNHVYLNMKNSITRERKNRIISRISSGNYLEVLEEIQKEKKIDPNDPFLYYYSALSLLKLGKFSEALKEIDKAISLSNKSEYHQLASVILENLGELDEALKEIDKAIKINPYDDINYYTYAHLLFKKGLMKEAMIQYGRFIEMTSKEELLDEAVKNLEVGVLFNSKAEFYYYLGLGYFKLKKFKKSTENFKKAYELSSEDKYLYWMKRAEEKAKTFN
ncbi:tetratricopeptide repeat protein [Acidianus manzaensis]|uniref:Uncharacterized protein n=1 Tax=Acidianus manzaensis TaxID=282676 RepID=A0A1W6K2T5_9CREN|nr:tetratricopeptide repeat protein [Acidianus manzaensis]ARM76836.1 hypothetical protein B6F84_12945 [Acidianus manzaensis]